LASTTVVPLIWSLAAACAGWTAMGMAHNDKDITETACPRNGTTVNGVRGRRGIPVLVRPSARRPWHRRLVAER
jgi:hypothetical protein